MAHAWEEQLVPKFSRVVQKLQVSSCLDRLLEKGLLTLEQYNHVRSPASGTAEEKARLLLAEILPKKGPNSFHSFCEVLLSMPQQAFIVTDILGYTVAARPVDTPSSQGLLSRSVSEEKTSPTANQAEAREHPVREHPQPSQNRTDDGTGDGIAAASSSPHGGETADTTLQWEELKKAHPDLELLPTLCLDHLRLFGLLTDEEDSQLQQTSLLESNRSQILRDILLSKGESSITVICGVLRRIAHKNHVVLPETEETEVKDVNQNLRPQISGAPHAEASFEHEAGQQLMTSFPTLRKGKGSSQPWKVKRQGSVVFFFNPKFKKLIKPIEEVICSMCNQHFEIDEKQVNCYYIKTTAMKVMIASWEGYDLYPCFLDLDSKLVVLVVDGMEPDKVESYRYALESVIRTNLLLAKIKIPLPPCDGNVLQIIPGCACVVFSFSIGLCISLLCVLGDRRSWTELRISLQETLPESTKAVIRLGGLPPITLFCHETERQKSGGKDVTLEDQDSSTLAASTSEIYHSNQDVKARSAILELLLKDFEQQVARYFGKLDSFDDTLEFSKKQLDLVKVNLNHQLEITKQRRGDIHEAAKATLSIFITETTDSVVASYAKAKKKSVDAFRHARSLCEMSVQFSGVLQSLRKRRNKLQQGCARCQQLLEGLKSRTAARMVCKKNDATGKLDSPKKDYKSESSAESGSELGTDYDSESDPETDWTLFHRAVIGGKYEVVQDLLKEGVDVNIQSKIGRTALHEASYRGYDSIVRILLENSADAHIRDESGRTALFEASYTGRDQIVQMLLESRVDVNARDELVPYVNRPSDYDVKKATDVLRSYYVEGGVFGAGSKAIYGFEMNESSMRAIETWITGKHDTTEVVITQLRDSLKLMSHSEQSVEKMHFTVRTSDGFLMGTLVLAYRTSLEKTKDIAICFGFARFKTTQPWYSKVKDAVFGGKSGIAHDEFKNAVDVTCRKIMADTISSQR